MTEAGTRYTFPCPGRGCTVTHSWFGCIESGTRKFPVLVCSECKNFVECRLGDECVYVRNGDGYHQSAFDARVYETYLTRTPVAVREALRESMVCFRAESWTGCIVLARKAVEVMAVELGGRGRTLAQRLADLRDRGLVAAEFAFVENLVRNLGNLAVHYDRATTTTSSDQEAFIALAYAYEVSKAVFRPDQVSPASPDDMHDSQRHWYELYGLHPGGEYGKRLYTN